MVGNTPLIRIKALCKKFNLPNLYIKDESKNPTGTFKDRKSKAIVGQAYRKRIKFLMAITTGNFGCSLSKFAKQAGIKTILFVPKNLKHKMLKTLEKNAILIKVDLEKEILTTAMMKKIAERHIANNLVKTLNATNIYSDFYDNLFKEIDGQLKFKAISHIIIPIGSGELFASAIRHYHGKKTQIIGVAAKSRKTIATMIYCKYRPVIDNIRKTRKYKNYRIVYLPENQIKKIYNFMKSKISCEPSAAAAFAVLEILKFNPDGRVLVINTGNGLKNFHSSQ